MALFDEIERDVGPIEGAVFNPGANVNFPIRDLTARVCWRPRRSPRNYRLLHCQPLSAWTSGLDLRPYERW